MKGILAAVAFAGLVCGCAAPPEAIGPAYVSPYQYSNLNCRELQEEAQRVDAALAQASAQQEQARGNDIAGVILIGVPVSTLSGTNVAPQVASLKGQKEALHLALLNKHCLR
jgi:hypothetical protein